MNSISKLNGREIASRPEKPGDNDLVGPQRTLGHPYQAIRLIQGHRTRSPDLVAGPTVGTQHSANRRSFGEPSLFAFFDLPLVFDFAFGLAFLL